MCNVYKFFCIFFALLKKKGLSNRGSNLSRSKKAVVIIFHNMYWWLTNFSYTQRKYYAFLCRTRMSKSLILKWFLINQNSCEEAEWKKFAYPYLISHVMRTHKRSHEISKSPKSLTLIWFIINHNSFEEDE
jgi:hypothetical protein